MADLLDKHKIYHKARGSRVLDDKTAEAVAYLLSDPRTDGDVLSLIPGLTADQLETIKADGVFLKRVTYLKDRANRKRKKPKTPDEYMRFALRRLHKLAEGATEEKNQVAAAEKLGSLAHKIKLNQADEGAAAPVDFSDLQKAYEEDGK